MHTHDVPVDATLVEDGNFRFAGGVACGERLLQNPDPPSAICASNDDTAAAVVSVAHRLGLALRRISRSQASTTRRSRRCSGRC
jgi:LacI family transcriptional regulator